MLLAPCGQVGRVAVHTKHLTAMRASQALVETVARVERLMARTIGFFHERRRGQ